VCFGRSLAAFGILRGGEVLEGSFLRGEGRPKISGDGNQMSGQSVLADRLTVLQVRSRLQMGDSFFDAEEHSAVGVVDLSDLDK